MPRCVSSQARDIEAKKRAGALEKEKAAAAASKSRRKRGAKAAAAKAGGGGGGVAVGDAANPVSVLPPVTVEVVANLTRMAAAGENRGGGGGSQVPRYHRETACQVNFSEDDTVVESTSSTSHACLLGPTGDALEINSGTWKWSVTLLKDNNTSGAVLYCAVM